MYKIYIENRLIYISSQPDRLQKYCLFHKFHDQKALSDQIGKFIESPDTGCINIYSYKLDHLWNSFTENFHVVEASGGIVLDGRGSMLLIKKNDHWDAPKGHFEPHETPEMCARREINEECGVECGEKISDLSPSFHIYKFDGEYYLKKTYWFLFRLSGSTAITPEKEEGITEAAWSDRDRLSGIRGSMWRSVADVINEVLHKHHGYL